MREARLHNEIELFQQIAEGDSQSFKKLYDHYVPILVPFLFKLTGKDTPTDELLQETFIRIWMTRSKLPDVQFPSAWIYEVTSHVAFTWLKRKLRYDLLMTNYQDLRELKSNQSPVEDHFHLQETRKLIREAIDQLPEQRKRIYQLSRTEGLTIPQIALELGLSPSTVKNTLVKALACIRAHLAGQGYELPFVLLYMIS